MSERVLEIPIGLDGEKREGMQSLPETELSEGQIISFPPLPFANELESRDGTEPITRRDFLHHIRNRALQVGAGAVILQYGAMAETISGCANFIGHDMNKLWPHNKPTFSFVNAEAYKGQKELAIFFPGFGDVHSAQEAAIWQFKSKLARRTDLITGFLDYSHQGATTAEMVETIRNAVDLNRIESLTLFGRSMGGEFEIAVAAELGIPVKSMVLCSSPFSLEDGDFGNVGKLAAMAPRRRWIGTLAKFFISTYRSSAQHGFDPGVNLAEGWQSTLSGENPEALQKEVIVDEGINLNSPAMLKKLRKVFIPGFSQVIYAATENPRTDKTVLVVSSGRKYLELFRDKLGVKFNLKDIPVDGHANVRATSIELEEWTQKVSNTQILASK